jgi:S-adenosylmethionine-dependent methyltransferase
MGRGRNVMSVPPPRAVELFERDAENFEHYLLSPLGRLRTELVWEGLKPVLDAARIPFRVLDLGGGTGAFALRLAALGHEVLLVDPAQAMLNLALRKARQLPADAQTRFRVQQGTLEDVGPAGEAFTLVLCHNVLEYVVSTVVANRDVEPLRTVVQEQDPQQALQMLGKNVHPSSLFGGYRRVFDLRELVTMLDGAGFASARVRGIRVACDYLSPVQLEQDAVWQAALELERRLADRAPHKYLARYLHVLARPR